MTRRTKLILLVMALVSVLGLTVATNAWFVSVSATPAGKISSALVHYLPDGGNQTIPSILDYGNLISGSGADTDGVALVLPGDRLLPVVTTTTDADGKQTHTVRTSIARPFETGESVDTVIHWELRRSGETELTYRQRDLMRATAPQDKWYKNDVPLTSGDPVPSPGPADYIAETTTTETTSAITAEGHPATQTTTTVITVYTPRKAEGDTYRLETITIKTVIEEAATISPAGSDSLWAAAEKTHTATETVIFVDSSAAPAADKLPTRSLLLITPLSATLEGAVIPLTLENRSTVATNVRVGLNATLAAPNAAPTTLEVRKKTEANGSDTYYLGSMAEGYFIELLAFQPAANWARVTEQTAKTSPWLLFDLKVDGSVAIPPIPSPPPADPDAPDDPVSRPAPVYYPVTADFGIVSRSAGLDSSITPTQFERLFNQLYCEEVPTITIHLSYYVRQADFMDWTEFYSTSIDMSVFQ